MKRFKGIVVLFMVLSSLTFGSLMDALKNSFDKNMEFIFGTDYEAISEFRSNYALQILHGDVVTYKGKFLTLEQVIQNITEGVIIDDIMQNGTDVVASDYHLSAEITLKDWVMSTTDVIDVPASMLLRIDTYKVRYIYDIDATISKLKSYPFNIISYAPEQIEIIVNSILSGKSSALQNLVFRRNMEIFNPVDKQRSSDLATMMETIPEYIVTYKENTDTGKGLIVFDNNVIKLSVPYKFDKNGNYNASMDIDDMVVEVITTDSKTGQYKSSQRILPSPALESSIIMKERLLKGGVDTYETTSSEQDELIGGNDFIELRSRINAIFDITDRGETL